MPKVTRKRLSRGSKLYSEHFDALGSIKTHLSTPAVDRTQMPSGRGTFRLNFHIPYITGEYLEYTTESAAGHKRPYSIPFLLPPLQDEFSATTARFTLDEDTPLPVLEEVHFSFDQRAEPAAITGHAYNSGGTGHPTVPLEDGKLAFEEVGDRYNVGLAILEKSQEYFGESGGSFALDKEVWSVEVPSDAFSGKYFRLNPYVITDIGRELHPYKTYAFQIYVDDLYNGNASTVEDFALVSVHVSLKFSHPLVGRDTGTEQNMPTTHNGVQTGITVSGYATQPVAGGALYAGDESASISRLMGELDDHWKDGFRGGYDRFADALPDQEISDDSCYETIVIPLMQCRKYGGVAYNNSSGLAWEPYWTATTREEFGDRRVLPIVEPLTIQHVFLAFSMNPFEEQVSGSRVNDYVSASVTGWDLEVGLAAGSGMLGDLVAYDQIAYLSHTDLGGTNGQNLPNLVDRINGYLETSTSTPQWAIINLPLVGSGGVGYFSQGHPIFVGRGTNNVSARSNIAAGAPKCGGCETFLEARMKWSGIAAGAGASRNGEILSGWGGHYMIVIAKKFMTYPRNYRSYR